MRIFVLFFSLLLMLVWIGVWIWAEQQIPPFDVSGLHAIGFLFILPAMVLAASGTWIRPALGLLLVAAFMYLSVLIAGQISN